MIFLWRFLLFLLSFLDVLVITAGDILHATLHLAVGWQLGALLFLPALQTFVPCLLGASLTGEAAKRQHKDNTRVFAHIDFLKKRGDGAGPGCDDVFAVQLCNARKKKPKVEMVVQKNGFPVPMEWGSAKLPA